jgi:glucans biosynthesis protein
VPSPLRLLLAAPALAASALGASPASAAVFGLDDVSARARALAAAPYEGPSGQVPNWLLEIDYDAWRDIRFRPERALWRREGLPFQVQFFHPGLYYDRTVVVNVVDAEGVHALPFARDRFDYGKNTFADQVPEDLGYAGFRLHHPIKTPGYHDEVIVFLGATYFRAVGRRTGFGLSARGVAIDTALPSGEEFPWFREFWLVRPAPRHAEMALYALLDSPSLTGAYRFVVHPGEETVVNVDARLFRRREVAKLGLAPLTSMFFHGENTRREFDDFRPEVHDSDGLLVAMGTGEWLWRPLDNPRRLDVTSFQVDGLRGFGLLQRDREFDHYQDLETHPQERASAWVAPRGNWGAGRVELVQIPTDDDIHDNAVTYFVPERLPPLDQPYAFAYDLIWYGDGSGRPPGARALATRSDPGSEEGATRFVIDFAGGALAQLGPSAPVQGVVTVGSGSGSEGQVVEQHVVPNPHTGGWRLVFEVRPSGGEPVELRAFLAVDGNALGETWSFVLNP